MYENYELIFKSTWVEKEGMVYTPETRKDYIEQRLSTKIFHCLDHIEAKFAKPIEKKVCLIKTK